MAYRKRFIWDGQKSQSIENLDQWMDAAQMGSDTHKLYAAVPYVYRGVQIRANAISRVPCYIMRNNEPVEYPLEYMLPRLLWLTEAALCIYGASYWLRAKNRAQIEGYRWIVSTSIKIEADAENGLTGFVRTVGTQEIKYTPEQLVYFWQPALDKEVGAGVSPVEAALTVCGLSKSINEFASMFFSRGAIPATLITVEGNAPDTELRRMEEWWKRLLQGVQRAWETVAVRANVDVKQIGQPVKDLAMTELTDTARRQICIALGIPQSLMEESANYATANVHHVQLYTETIAPEIELITTTLNEQAFKPQGLEIVLAVDELDVMQADESERAGSLKQLHEAGLPLVLAMQMLGYDLPEGWDWEDIEAREREKEAQAQQARERLAAMGDQGQAAQQDNADDAQDEAEAQGARAKADKELASWRRYAVKHGVEKAQGFNCENVRPDLAAVIRGRLAAAMDAEEVKAAFVGPFLVKNQSAAEAALMAALLAIYTQHLDKIVAAVKRGEMPDLSGMNAAIVGAVSIAMTDMVTEVMVDLMLEMGVGLDYMAVLTDAGAWARQYTYGMIKGVEQTQVARLQQIIGQLADGTLQKEQVVDLIRPMFGEVRARMIATTEITRARSQAAMMYRKELEARGVRTVERWLTAEDERVCAICGPLDHTTREVWGAQFPEGPPAHVNCRCGVVIETA